jgi:hypothetical protein
MTSLAQALFFVSSYSPLIAVFALLDTFGRGTPSIVCAALAVLGVALLPLLWLTNRRTSAQPLTIAKASPRDGDVLAYIASYLVPFASTAAHTVHEKIAIAIFIGLIGVLYVRTEMFYVNPLLALAGFRVYAVETPRGTPVVLLCRRRFIAPSTSIEAVRISDYIWREKRT